MGDDGRAHHAQDMTARHAAGFVVAALLLLCARGKETAPERQSESTPTPMGLRTHIALPVSPGSTVQGLVDVGGHDIYARCSNTGTPTVVYFTGWAP